MFQSGVIMLLAAALVLDALLSSCKAVCESVLALQVHSLQVRLVCTHGNKHMMLVPSRLSPFHLHGTSTDMTNYRKKDTDDARG